MYCLGSISAENKYQSIIDNSVYRTLNLFYFHKDRSLNTEAFFNAFLVTICDIQVANAQHSCFLISRNYLKKF